MNKSFSRRLEQIRKELSLTQEELAKELSVTRATISNYEKCERTPDIDFLDNFYMFCKKSGYTSMTFEYLLGYTNNLNHNFSELNSLLLSDVAIQNIKKLNINQKEVLNEFLNDKYLTKIFDIIIYKATFAPIILERTTYSLKKLIFNEELVSVKYANEDKINFDSFSIGTLLDTQLNTLVHRLIDNTISSIEPDKDFLDKL